jgi:hypothetical protein
LEKSQLTFSADVKFKHVFESQRTQQDRGKASLWALTVLLDKTAIIFAKNQSRKTGKMRERANINVNSFHLKLNYGKEKPQKRLNWPPDKTDFGEDEDAEMSGKPRASVCQANPTTPQKSLSSTRTLPNFYKGTAAD